MGRPEPTTPWPPVGRPRPRGANHGRKRWYRLVRQRAGRDERRGVGASHSIDEAGEPPEGPCGEKGTPCHDTVGGKHGGCIETLNREHEPTTVAASGTRRSADSLREPS